MSVAKELLSSIIHVLIFLIQFAFVITFFCFIFAVFVGHFDPTSGLLDLTFKIFWQSGLTGILLLILTYLLTMGLEHWFRETD